MKHILFILFVGFMLVSCAPTNRSYRAHRVPPGQSHKMPPGQAKKVYGSQSAKPFAPGQQKKQRRW